MGEDLKITHDILLAGPDFESCRTHVEIFFAKSMLLRYDEVLVLEEESFSGADGRFWTRLEDGIGANRQVVKELLENLRVEGFVTLEEFENVNKGYVSKIFHTVAHLLDGFIGIDSRFYNLEEDSHGVSQEFRQRVSAAPDDYWILRVQGKVFSAPEEPFDALRTFERRGGDSA